MAVGRGVATRRSSAGVGVFGNVAEACEFDPQPRPSDALTARPASRHSPLMENVAFFMR